MFELRTGDRKAGAGVPLAEQRRSMQGVPLAPK
jgi:hypothetical protein